MVPILDITLEKRRGRKKSNFSDLVSAYLQKGAVKNRKRIFIILSSFCMYVHMHVCAFSICLQKGTVKNRITTLNNFILPMHVHEHMYVHVHMIVHCFKINADFLQKIGKNSRKY
jgi:hypothetical protein